MYESSDHTTNNWPKFRYATCNLSKKSSAEGAITSERQKVSGKKNRNESLTHQGQQKCITHFVRRKGEIKCWLKRRKRKLKCSLINKENKNGLLTWQEGKEIWSAHTKEWEGNWSAHLRNQWGLNPDSSILILIAMRRPTSSPTISNRSSLPKNHSHDSLVCRSSRFTPLCLDKQSTKSLLSARQANPYPSAVPINKHTFSLPKNHSHVSLLCRSSQLIPLCHDPRNQYFFLPYQTSQFMSLCCANKSLSGIPSQPNKSTHGSFLCPTINTSPCCAPQSPRLLAVPHNQNVSLLCPTINTSLCCSKQYIQRLFSLPNTQPHVPSSQPSKHPNIRLVE